MAAKQFTEKMVVSDKLTAGNFASMKGAPASELIITDHLPDDMQLDAAVNSDAVASDVAAVDQPLLMAKADIELSPSESAGVVVSDADFAYTDHIVSDIAEAVSDQSELVAMNSVQHISDNTVLAAETGSGMPWGWIGAGAVAGGVGGYLLSVGHGDSAGPVAQPEVHIIVEDVEIVEQTGSYITRAFFDINGNGVKDAEDSTEAFFGGLNDNVDLANNKVTIHFHDVPVAETGGNAKTVFGAAASAPLDFSGFTEDDLIELDMNAYFGDNAHRRDEQITLDTIYKTIDSFNMRIATELALISNKHGFIGTSYGPDSNSSGLIMGVVTADHVNLGYHLQAATFGAFNPVANPGHVDFVYYSHPLD